MQRMRVRWMLGTSPQMQAIDFGWLWEEISTYNKRATERIGSMKLPCLGLANDYSGLAEPL